MKANEEPTAEQKAAAAELYADFKRHVEEKGRADQNAPTCKLTGKLADWDCCDEHRRLKVQHADLERRAEAIFPGYDGSMEAKSFLGRGYALSAKWWYILGISEPLDSLRADGFFDEVGQKPLTQESWNAIRDRLNIRREKQ